MELNTAAKLARDLMDQHGLTRWRFRFDRGTKRFGCCRHVTREITLSKRLTELNAEPEVRDTILHEIAHALVGHEHGHDSIWARRCREIGGDGQRYYDPTKVATVPGKYVGTCPNCQREVERQRRPRGTQACSDCCRRHNHGRYDARFVFVWTERGRTRLPRPAPTKQLVDFQGAKPATVKVKRVNDHEYGSTDGRWDFIRGYGTTSERTWTVIDNDPGFGNNGSVIHAETYPTLKAAKEAVL